MAREKAKLVKQEKVDPQSLEAKLLNEQQSRIEMYGKFCKGEISEGEYVRFRDDSVVREQQLEAKLVVERGRKAWLQEKEDMLMPLLAVKRDCMLDVVDVVLVGEEVKVKMKAERFLD